MSTIVTRSGKGSPLTHAEVDSNFTNLNTDKLELSGGTLTGTLNFGDNVKAQFGASADLQVYHDGSNSYITDAGTGSLVLSSNGFGVKMITDAGDTLFKADKDGANNLYYDNTKRLETTSSGVKVYDRLNVDLIQSSSHGASSELDFDDDVDPFGTGQANFTTLRSIGGLNLVFDTNNNDTNGFFIGQNSGDTSLATKHFFINGLGDISFYEDTGTTAKFFWDASTERLGIGTTSPSTRLDVVGEIRSSGTTAGNGGKLTLGNDDFGTYEWFTQQDGTTGEYVVTVTGTGGAEFKIGSDGSDYTNAYALVGNGVKLDSSGSSYLNGGNVGIGTSSPSEKLDVNGTAKATTFKFSNWTITESGGSLYFATGGTNKMKLDASGNLQVVGSVDANATIT